MTVRKSNVTMASVTVTSNDKQGSQKFVKIIPMQFTRACSSYPHFSSSDKPYSKGLSGTDKECHKTKKLSTTDRGSNMKDATTLGSSTTTSAASTSSSSGSNEYLLSSAIKNYSDNDRRLVAPASQHSHHPKDDGIIIHRQEGDINSPKNQELGLRRPRRRGRSLSLRKVVIQEEDDEEEVCVAMRKRRSKSMPPPDKVSQEHIMYCTTKRLTQGIPKESELPIDLIDTIFITTTPASSKIFTYRPTTSRTRLPQGILVGHAAKDSYNLKKWSTRSPRSTNHTTTTTTTTDKYYQVVVSGKNDTHNDKEKGATFDNGKEANTNDR